MFYHLLWIALVGSCGIWPLIMITFPLVLSPIVLPIKNLTDPWLGKGNDPEEDRETLLGQAILAWVATLIVCATPANSEQLPVAYVGIYCLTLLGAVLKVKVPVPAEWNAKWITRIGLSSQALWILQGENVLKSVNTFLS